MRIAPSILAVGLPAVAASVLLGAGQPAPATSTLPSSAPPTFTDVTRTSGIDFVNICGEADRKDYVFEAKGGGVGVLDFDNDGLMDIVFPQGSTLDRWRRGDNPTPTLYRNLGSGRFEDITRRAGLNHRGWGMGVTAADYDNDGWVDLYFTYLGPDVLYHNNGDGTFTDVTARAGIKADGWSSSATFADFDRDGFLDLYVASYLDIGPNKLPDRRSGGMCSYLGHDTLCGPRGLPGAWNHFFHNNGDGTFSDRTTESGAREPEAYYSLGVVAGDVDNDGDPDIYVSNDSTPSLLFVNRGNGIFEDHSYASGLAVSGDGNEQAGMGVDLADYDNDGRLDAYKTHFAHDYSTLYHNVGRLLFEDVTAAAGVQEPEWPLVSWSTRLADFNQDGWKDILHVNGHVYPFLRTPVGNESYAQPVTTLYLNRGNGTFSDASGLCGTDARQPAVGRGAAFADLDNDGDIDVVIAVLNGHPILLRNNPPAGTHWLMVRTIGRRSNTDGIGARVTIEAGGQRQIWEIKRTVGIYSCSDPRAHFGLGSATKADLLRIDWPSGTVDEQRNVPADHHYVAEEGGGLRIETQGAR
jgi:hypothetical protein